MLKLFWALFPACRPDTHRHTHAPVDTELTRTAAGLLAASGSLDLVRRVAVRWNRRLTTTAGLARYERAEVSLNPRLKEFPEEVDRTLRHELAHLLAAERAGRRRIAAHGPEWRQACADLGIPGESCCHNLPLPRRRQERRHTYRCPRCAFLLHRVRPLDRRRRRLACQECCRRYAGGRFDARFEFVKVHDAGGLVPAASHSR